ncbi:MAG: hypothetical protein QME58_01740 [Bacteroidota bacterium]|nr:hypothetical protein [Bacteroidota bacterium]
MKILHRMLVYSIPLPTMIESFFKWDAKKYPDFLSKKVKLSETLKYYLGDF